LRMNSAEAKETEVWLKERSGLSVEPSVCIFNAVSDAKR